MATVFGMKRVYRVLVATAVAISASVVTGPLLQSGNAVSAAPPGDDAVVAFEVRGVGNGHGRGLSQWGSYGRALAGQSWQEILGAYYGGTTPGDRAGARIRTWLTGLNSTSSAGVISAGTTAGWSGANLAGAATGYRSLYAAFTGGNTFTVYGSTGELGCPGGLNIEVPMVYLQQGASGTSVSALQRLLAHLGYSPGPVDGQFGPQTAAAVSAFQTASGLAATGTWGSPEWTRANELVGSGAITSWTTLATNVAGPIRFTTTASEASAAPGEVLGLCQPDGSIVHYRGTVEFADTSDGRRVINDLSVESYLRGVVPKESPAYWGDGGGGLGMNALRAQSVAARSYGLSQTRRSFAGTCDTSSCQVYGGAATRVSPSSGVRPVEDARTDQAILDTAGVVRVWAGTNNLVSTEFSASNGARTAGGAFPPVDDPWDDQPGNPNHVWTRVIDADTIAAKYGLTSANNVVTARDADSPYDGIWANEVRLGNGTSISAWDFRNDFDLPAPGFELVPIRRTVSGAGSFAFIGDSVGVSVAGEATSPLRVLLEGVHTSQVFNSRGGRPTGGGTDDGQDVAATIPLGTNLVVVELGYNDSPSTMPARIDALMQTLRDRGVGRVAWVTVSERRTSTNFAQTNAAIVAAAGRWSEMIVIDWHAASAGSAADRWYSDNVHLTSSGQAEFGVWLRDRIVELSSQGYQPPRRVAAGEVLRVPVLGVAGVPVSGVAGVALNVIAVAPSGPGFLRVWDCALAEPETSSVNFTSAGAVEPNAVLVPFAPGSAGEVCVSSPLVSVDVVVDVAGWFDAGLRSGIGRAVDTRLAGAPDRVAAGGVLRVPVFGVGGVPVSGVAGVALNVIAVGPSGPGYLRVWDCALAEPETSSVNFMWAGAVEPNAVLVPFAPGSAGEVCVSSPMVSVDVVVDVAGWFDAGLRSGVGRVVDTRLAGAPDRVAAGGVLRVPVLGVAGVPGAGSGQSVAGVALNVIAVAPSGPGYLRVWDCALPEPETSSVNFMWAGAVEPNAVLVPFAPGSAGEVCVSSPMVSVDVVVDVAGWFDAGLRSGMGRVRDTRVGYIAA